MKFLFDTNTFLWFTGEPERLTRRAYGLIADPQNEILFSHVSAWEIAIKVSAGKLRFGENIADMLPRELQNHAFQGLGIELRHMLATAELPWLHRDPFDRLLVCQAQIENLPILTSDRSIAQYNVEVIW